MYSYTYSYPYTTHWTSDIFYYSQVRIKFLLLYLLILPKNSIVNIGFSIISRLLLMSNNRKKQI